MDFRLHANCSKPGPCQPFTNNVFHGTTSMGFCWPTRSKIYSKEQKNSMPPINPNPSFSLWLPIKHEIYRHRSHSTALWYRDYVHSTSIPLSSANTFTGEINSIRRRWLSKAKKLIHPSPQHPTCPCSPSHLCNPIGMYTGATLSAAPKLSIPV